MSARKIKKKTSPKSRKRRPSKRKPRAQAASEALLRIPATRVLYERITPIVDIGRIWDDLGQRFPFEFRVSYRRPEDLLVCDFIFDNFRRSGSKLARKDPERPSTLIVELPPQSFAEEAFLDATGPEVPTTPPANDNEEFEESSPVQKNVAVTKPEDLLPLPFARVRMAGPSRLALAMPADQTTIDFTAEAILHACRTWPMRLDINAVPEPPRRPFVEYSLT